MKNLLYSIYTGEYPNQSSGGPNNIIYKLIMNNNKYDYKSDYLSRDLFVSNLRIQNIDNISCERTLKKKITSFFSENSKIYRKIFGSDFYLQYHFYKNKKYFKAFRNKIDKYDLLHSQDSVSLALLNNKKPDKIKTIITVHSKGPLSDELRGLIRNERLREKIDKMFKELELKSVEKADIITFPSIAAKSFFEDSLNVSLKKDKIKIIYNGIDFNKINKLYVYEILKKYSIDNKNKLLFLNIASNAPEKNLDVLLKVIGTLKNKFNKEILLLNVGAEKKMPSELINIIKKMKIQTDVKFLGKIPNDDVISFLKATDIFIMTSEKVIFDLVVLEALASGACCVVSNDGGNKEIIKDGENGFLIDIDDVDAIAKKIISIIPYKNKVKENAIKTAKQFSVQKMINEYFEVYESLLNDV